MKVAIVVIFFGSFVTITLSCKTQKPNIVFILADDLGWNDVSLHGSDQIMTPNIDLLAYTGVHLGRYYSHAVCTPSRAAFLTGKYSHKIGMQGYPLLMSEDRGIPVNERLLPQLLKEAGYSTHLVGKWHVGSSRNQYLPTARGFDTHFGHRGGLVDYYEYTLEETFSPVGTVSGFGLFRNMTPAWDVEGYITDVYTDHATSVIEKHDKSSPLFLMLAHNAPHAGGLASNLQAPPDTVRHMRHIELTSRRMFGAMVKKLDDSVGAIFKALYHNKMLDNTIIVFASDNGGMTSGRYENYASNYPLRGIKMSPFEGGIRVPGLIWTANLNSSSHFWDGYMHVTDWMPTLLSAARINVPADIDGINQWENIQTKAPSDRTVMFEIDDYTGFSSIILEQYKMVTGNITESFGTHQGADLRGIIGEAPSYSETIQNSTVYKVLALFGLPFNTTYLSLRNNTTVHCNSTARSLCFPVNGTVCLFNIIEDPCETTDLSALHPKLIRRMKILLDKESATKISRSNPMRRDPLSVPSLHNYTWAPWMPDLMSS